MLDGIREGWGGMGEYQQKLGPLWYYVRFYECVVSDIIAAAPPSEMSLPSNYKDVLLLFNGARLAIPFRLFHYISALVPLLTSALYSSI